MITVNNIHLLLKLKKKNKMTTTFNLIKKSCTRILKKSTHLLKTFTYKLLGNFFTYLKDSILSLFNSDHKFTHLGNKSIAEFNLEHIQQDLNEFLKNPSLNNSEDKNKKEYLNYTFQYSSKTSGYSP
ncbi:hypothetical protein BHE89_09970 [Shigella sp. FC1967]|nr:hypothetical protein BHE89_09970 [Shigella sp. FC1967]